MAALKRSLGEEEKPVRKKSAPKKAAAAQAASKPAHKMA
jgi:hypothetical protein